MNKRIFNSFLATGLTLALASCGENTWNDHYLDGFEGGADYNQPSSTEGSYTLTSEDYAAISKLLQAEATTDEETAAAKAIGSNEYFDKTSVYPASVALPYFMKTASFPYYLDANGSNVAVTYSEADAVPAELGQIAAAETYTVSTADYQEVWGSEENYTASFAPSHTAARSLPGILKAAFPTATEGQYAVVSYNTSAVDPVFGATEEPKFELSNTLGSIAKGDEVDINGVVMAISTQGPIVTDASGSVFVYAPTNNSDIKVGDQISVSSTVDSFNYGFQIKRGSTVEVKGNQSVTYPTAKTWTGAEIDQFVADAMAADAAPIKPVYSTFTGKAIVTNYINIELDGTTVQLSPYGATDAVKALFTDGATVTVEGYMIAIASKGKFLNTVVTKVNGVAVNTAAKAPASRAVSVASTAENAVYMFNGSAWALAEGVAALNPADYAAIGVDNNKLEDVDVYVPLFLKHNFPYALSGDMKYVVYNGTKCDLFVYNGSEWELNNNGLETVTARFTKKSGEWNFVKYLGKAVFNIFNEDELILDRSYLFVCTDQCATPVAAGKTYGYLTAVTVPVNNGVIVLDNDAYAFTLASTYTDEATGKTYEAPEGQFLFQDSYGRYLYLTGGYNSPNLTNAPAIKDGQIDETYLFTAKNDGTGTWTIMRGDRTMCLSTNYGSYGFYQPSGISDKEVRPSLYLLD